MNEPQAFVDLQDAGNAQAQLILLSIARFADWNTGQCFPSQEQLARMAKCTDRTVRTYLARLEEDGFISRESRRKSNGAVQSDLITLVGYVDWITALRQGGNVARPKAVDRYEKAPEQPENLSGTPPENLSPPPGTLLSAPPGKQGSGYNQTSLELQGNQDARAREGSNSDFDKVKMQPQARASITIKAGDAPWSDWLKWLGERDPDLADAAEAAGELAACSRWPRDDSPKPTVPKVARLSLRSKAITREAAE